jgi:hypothetical protein
MPTRLTSTPQPLPDAEPRQSTQRGILAIALILGRAPAIRRAFATARSFLTDFSSNSPADARRILGGTDVGGGSNGELDVDDALAMPLEDAVRRGQRMRAAQPSDLTDIDLGPAR